MLKVGITGGIGSGKTLVSGIFSRLGIPVFYADAEAAAITRNNLKVNEDIIDLFGKQVVGPTGELNRKKIRELLFQDSQAREQMNTLIHPLVQLRFEEWCAEKKDVPFVLKEAAILFESGSFKGLDKIVMVYAPDDLRVKRVVKRDKVDKDQVELIMKNQMDEQEKIKRSDFVIFNDDVQMLIPQVLTIFETLKKVDKEI